MSRHMYFRRLFGIGVGVGGLSFAVHKYKFRKDNNPAVVTTCASHHDQPAATSGVSSQVFDVAVIGGGVVGLAVAREAAVAGHKVVLIERETDVAAGASSGNSGLGCTGYDSPVGSLERQLLRRAIQRHPAIYRSFGLSYDHVRKSGSLVVAWDDEQLSKLPSVLKENEEAGDTEAQLLSQQDLREIAGPGLSTEALGAVLCPREAVVEPWLVPIGYAESARLHNADLRLGTAAVDATYDHDIGVWTVDTQPSGVKSVGRSAVGEVLTPLVAEPTAPQGLGSCVRAKVVVNCAGLYGDTVEKLREKSDNKQKKASIYNTTTTTSLTTPNHGSSINDTTTTTSIPANTTINTTTNTTTSTTNTTTTLTQPNFTIAPRKGQFVVFDPPPGLELPHHIIEPVASQFTKGVIVWVTPYGNVVVGPTAVTQTSKTDRSTDTDTIKTLRSWGEKVIPGLGTAKLLGTYSGLRPATEHRDYQIQAHPHVNWVTVGGIRSTGLTASSGIAEYVATLYTPMIYADHDHDHDHVNATCSIPWCPGDGDSALLKGVTEAASQPEPLDPRVVHHNDTVPELSVLAASYKALGDGNVEVYGRKWRVTHPISSFGMESYNQIRGGPDI